MPNKVKLQSYVQRNNLFTFTIHDTAVTAPINSTPLTAGSSCVPPLP